MVNDQIIPMKNGYFIGNINPTFSDKPICAERIAEPCSGQDIGIFRLDCQEMQRTLLRDAKIWIVVQWIDSGLRGN